MNEIPDGVSCRAFYILIISMINIASSNKQNKTPSSVFPVYSMV